MPTNYHRPTRDRFEAECLDCGEIYIPESGDDLTHLVCQDGTECGGRGVVIAGWTA